MDAKRILSLAGLCRRAGGIIPGSDALLGAVKRGKNALPAVIVLSSEASDRTKKQITDKAVYHSIPLIVIDADPDTVGRALGLISPCAVFGVTKRGPYEKLLEAARSEQQVKISAEDHQAIK